MAGSNNFVLSVKSWIERTNAIGIRSKAGRYGGTYALIKDWGAKKDKQKIRFIDLMK